jgi:hypothetical protein
MAAAGDEDDRDSGAGEDTAEGAADRSGAHDDVARRVRHGHVGDRDGHCTYSADGVGQSPVSASERVPARAADQSRADRRARETGRTAYLNADAASQAAPDLELLTVFT